MFWTMNMTNDIVPHGFQKFITLWVPEVVMIMIMIMIMIMVMGMVLIMVMTMGMAMTIIVVPQGFQKGVTLGIL